MKPLHTDRGDYRGYFLSASLLSTSVLLFLLLYRKLDPVFMEIWGARSGWYMDTYRTCGAKVWRMLYRSTSSWVFLWLPILWLLSTYLIQSALKTSSARVFNKVHIVLIFVLLGIAFLSFFGLMLMPLITSANGATAGLGIAQSPYPW